MMDEAKLDIVRKHMKGLKPPGHYDRVYKDECMFSFDTPESDGGLYVNMQTFQGFGEAFVALDHQKTGNCLYLHEKWDRVPLSDEEKDSMDAKPQKLAIGGESGFQVDKKDYKIEKVNHLVVWPNNARIPLPCPDLPELVINTLTAIIAHDSASAQEAVAMWEEERKESKYAKDLPQLDNGRRIPSDPSIWKCDDTGVTENLWLNLSTGHIGSGRQNWDGSGGNGSALQHYEATGKKYPLVVKLGTITPHGADVFSYAGDENDMVVDPYLSKHLAHWGINMMQMEKTEKTMDELQVELNMAFEFDKITEAGSGLQPLSGPGFVGLRNLGNSCYMNSVLQVLWSLPHVQQHYLPYADTIFFSAPQDVQNDFASQMTKVGLALVQGATGELPSSNSNGALQPMSVKPHAFKTLVGRNHPEFSTAHQQDAAEYLQHLEEVMTRAERTLASRVPALADANPTANIFKFELEDRIQCGESGYVSYKRSPANMLSLDIPIDAATNKDELEDYKERELKRQKLKAEEAAAYITTDTSGDGGVQADATYIAKDVKEEPVIPKVPFTACLERFASDEAMEGYHSAVLGRRTAVATKRVRLATMPPYLVVQLKRYYVAPDWTAKKLEVLVDVPEHLSLEMLRAPGPQPNEQLQPEDAPAASTAPPAIQPDPALVAQLMGMGFSENGSKRAAVATNNASTEASMEWVLSHMEDPDFNDPLPEPSTSGTASAEAFDADALAMLTSMGFSEEQAKASLKACSGNIERAADWLFSHADDLGSAVASVVGAGQTQGAVAGAGEGTKPNDDKGEYSLIGIISHMGSNTACGHYVCHVKKEGRWVIFNDEKVAVSEHPPKELGYLYIFKRDDI